MTGGTKSSGTQKAYRPQCIRAAGPWLRPHKEEEEEEASFTFWPSYLCIHILVELKWTEAIRKTKLEEEDR
jgi:hypothetical protein